MVIHSGASALLQKATAARNTQRGNTQRKILVKKKIFKDGKTQVVKLVMAKIPVNGGGISKRKTHKVMAVDLFTSDEPGKKAKIPPHLETARRLAKITREGIREIKPKRLPKGSGKQSPPSNLSGRNVCHAAGTFR
jgi:hypothetical protein